jgi:hypothetical protein
VKLIYDCDKTSSIGDGKFSFKDWLTETNKDVKVGSRVLFTLGDGRGSNYRTGDAQYRFYRMFANAWQREGRDYPSYPDLSEPVLIQMDTEKNSDHQGMFITFLPDDEVLQDSYYGTTYGKRKNKVAFALYNSDQRLNYDAITHREIDWLKEMMHDRRVRRGYMHQMVFLIKAIRCKEDEMKIEEPFCQLVQTQLGCDLETALDYLHWWKTKNKWKRPLQEDDAKAFRMIVKEHNRKHNIKI